MDRIVSIQFSQSEEPMYIQLSDHIQKLIARGALEQGYRLPPIRKLAQYLGVNNVTVVHAYKLLEQKGYVFTRKGSGTYVSERSGLDACEHINIPTEESNLSEEDIQLMSRGYITLTDHSINFASATPTPDLFPIDDFKQVLTEVLDRDKGNAFGYDESRGYRPLCESISSFLMENYNICAHQDEIQIISGAQQGIDIIAKALISAGDFVLVENPTYTGAIAAFRSRGAKIIGVPMEHDGINIELLEKYIKIYRPKLIYTMPNHQNPTTFCYSIKKKEYLLELSYKYNVYIIEDDFSSDLNFEQNNITQPLKALDKWNRVLYIKSFSKILMPGLRIGFLIAPMEISNKLIHAKHSTDISSSGLIQRAFDLYLRKKIWGTHVAYMKSIFTRRYRKILHETSRFDELGVVRYTPSGGLNLWLTLPKDISGTQLYYECAKKNVLLIPGKIFYIDRVMQNDAKVRISFAAVYEEQIEKGVKVMEHCIKQLSNPGKAHTTYYSPLV